MSPQGPTLSPPPNPDEVATLITKFGGGATGGSSTFAASGQQSGTFTDWENVYVQIRLGDNHGVFRFLAVERDPMPTLWNRLQFQPGDEVAVYLGGLLAIAGEINTRQTAYDATTHGVMLQGESWAYYASKVSVQGPQGSLGGAIGKDQGNFDNMTFQEVAAQLLGRVGIPWEIVPKGATTLNPIPFKKLQADPGEIIFNFLEKIARPRGILIGSNERGALTFQWIVTANAVDQLIEGVNILRMQAIWKTDENRSDVGSLGQTAGSDDKQGTDASEQVFWTKGREFRYSPWLTVAEQPVWNLAELADRARNEARWVNSSTLIANVTVQGWKKSNGDLWRVNDMIYVKSPMAMLHDTLGVQAVTYQQDSASGTTTTLELVLPWKLGAADTTGQLGSDNPLVSDPNSTQPTFAGDTQQQPTFANVTNALPETPPASLPGGT